MTLNPFKYVIDNAIRDTVNEPPVGSVLYCYLVVAEHSGIYLGNGKIMELTGSGSISQVTPKEFLNGSLNSLEIYVGCNGKMPIGNSGVANRAIQYEKEIIVRDYNFVLDNCHQFTSACITGDPDNSRNFFWMLKDDCEKNLAIDTWRVWKDASEWKPQKKKNTITDIKTLQHKLRKKKDL